MLNKLETYTNYFSVVAQKNLSRANDSMSKAVERLSSGVRINHAADDASGIAVADKLRGQVNGLAMATLNAQDAISLLQTAEGGMEVMTDMLQRMRELSVQAGNGTYTSTDRIQLQKEVDQLKAEIDRIAAATEYNTKKLLTGASAGIWSASNANIEVIMRDVPAQGNYKMDFDVIAGQNAVYKSNILVGLDKADEILEKYRSEFPSAVKLETSDTNIDILDNGFSKMLETYYGVIGNADTDRSLATVSSTLTAVADIVSANATAGGYVKDINKNYINGYFSGTNGETALTAGFEADVTFGVNSTIGSGTMIAEKTNRNEVTLKIYSNDNKEYDTVKLALDDIKTNGINLIEGAGYKLTLSATSPFLTAFIDQLNSGNKFVLHTLNDDYIKTGGAVTTFKFSDTDPAWNNAGISNTFITAAVVKDKNITSHGMEVVNGELKQYSISTKDSGSDAMEDIEVTATWIANDFYKNLSIYDIKLKDLPNFTNADGRMVLDNTQNLTIRGNDRETRITLEGSDTIRDMMSKLGKAIVTDLEMGAAGVNTTDLVRLVTSAGTGDFATLGTLILQTALVGSNSELSFFADESVINGLGIVQIHDPKESNIRARIIDAHTRELIGEDVVSDHMLRGVIKGVDIRFDKNMGINAQFDKVNGKMVFTPAQLEDIFIHIVDKRTEVQVGANEGVTLDVSVARLDTTSLEIAQLSLATMAESQKAITQCDQAIEKVNHARASVGAQISRIEYTLKNISISHQNMIAAESRIRDLDIAQETAEFAKKQLLTNAAVAILAQANSLPQTALQLIGR